MAAFGITLIIGVYAVVNFHKPTQNYSVSGPVTSAPASLTLELDSPDDDLLVFDSDLRLSGKTLPNLRVLITSGAKNQIVQSETDGNFTSDFELGNGVNEITVTVFDESGEERSLQRTIYYSKEKI